MCSDSMTPRNNAFWRNRYPSPDVKRFAEQLERDMGLALALLNVPAYTIDEIREWLKVSECGLLNYLDDPDVGLAATIKKAEECR